MVGQDGELYKRKYLCLHGLYTLPQARATLSPLYGIIPAAYERKAGTGPEGRYGDLPLRQVEAKSHA